MSRLGRLCILLVVLGHSDRGTARADDTPPPAGIFLGVREPATWDEKAFPPRFLARELVRQAFLLAARDECGLLTRDTTLRETRLASGTPQAEFEMFCASGRISKRYETRYKLTRHDGTSDKPIWEWTFRMDINAPDMITTLAEKAEALSCGEFKNLIARTIGQKPVPAARNSALVPQDAWDALWEWNEIAVLGGLRRIHAEIRGKGESPELLAAMAVGYANLGTLCEYHLSPAHKAFSARALLYAERLVRKQHDSAWSLWHRAYVRAIVGLHHLAELDVNAANAAQSKAKEGPSLPFWTGVLDLFCQGKLPQMLEAAKTKPEQRLAAYFNLEAVMGVRSMGLTPKAATRLIESCADCLRGSEALCATRRFDLLRTVTSDAFEKFSTSLRKRVRDVPGLPDLLAKRVRESEPQIDPNDEVEFRTELVDDLRKAGNSIEDTLEPSLGSLGRMIEEIQFKQLLRRLELEANYLQGPTDETIAVFRPLCEHHRFSPFIDSFSKTKADLDKAGQALLKEVDLTEIGYAETAALQWLRQFDSKKAVRLLQIRYTHADVVFRDEMIGLEEGAAGTPDDKVHNPAYMRKMWKTSSNLPADVAMQIERNWKLHKSYAKRTETRFADNPLVMATLATKYCELKQYDDAARCAKQRIRIAADFASYDGLASIYRKEGDLDRYTETLEQALDNPSFGLDKASIYNRIARTYLGAKKASEARPYAEVAAAGQTPWGLETAARCQELLGNWDKSEALMRSISERNASQALDWLLWCHRTGHGNAQAAAECARKHFESLGTSVNVGQLEKIGVYYILSKEPAKALAVFKKGFEIGHDCFSAMHVAMLSDAAGDASGRDDYLAKTIEAGQKAARTSHGTAYARLAQMMRRSLSRKDASEFDTTEVEELLTKTRNAENPGNIQYFAGIFLKNRSQSERSRAYLIRSARSSAYKLYNVPLACQHLRELKLPVPMATATPADDTQ